MPKLKQKHRYYWLGAQCPHCQGHGCLPAKFDSYKVFIELQDAGPRDCGQAFATRKEAKQYVKKLRGDAFGGAAMYHIVAPDGECIVY